ncbi:hypothetical protein PRZ48_009963 [Zasmidium cellare]|uniref:Uncharacterized protein n=1 Tax=Zasmidium cellare TaxID=395010 RepID=A0ABR0ED69_ZASCE|nr:hypothetical protein PRZ48_009963 [Zasmidium cellare]
MPADDFEKGLMRTSQDSRSYSTFSAADSMKSRSTSTSSVSASSSRKPSMSAKSTKSSKTNKSSDSNKSSRSWIKRIFVGDVDEDESEEDREAKRLERNAMWRNMSMGYENVHVYADVGEFIGRAFRGAGTWSGGWPGSMPLSVSPFYNGL